MADEFYRTFKASGNLSNDYALVKMSNDEEVEVAGNNEKAVGVIQHTASDGEPVAVKFGGISKCTMNESVAVGKYVTASSNKGYGEVADAAGEHCIGTCIKSASGQGGVGKVVVAPFTAHADDS